ncbi:hypothetical protein JMUB6875_01270 [Nocardia sp. JMUB6875]
MRCTRFRWRTGIGHTASIGPGEGMTNPYIAPEEFPRRDREGRKLPAWAKPGAVVRFRVTGREAVECRIEGANDRGIRLSNGERFLIAHLRRGSSDDTSYFEKYDAVGRITRTARPV